MSSNSTYDVTKADIVPEKTAFLSELKVQSESCHFCSVFAQISTFTVVRDFVLAKTTFLSPFQVRSFKSVFTQMGSFVLPKTAKLEIVL